MPATGKITQVIGSTFDAEFPEDARFALVEQRLNREAGTHDDPQLIGSID